MPRIIELKWHCTSCQTRNILGRHKVCPSCGSPREKGEMDMSGLNTDRDGDGYNDAATVTDSDLLNLARAGADWFCTHCGSGNVGNGDSCSNCGAPRYGEKEENHPDPRFQRDHLRQEAPEPQTPEIRHRKTQSLRTAADEEFSRVRREEERKRILTWGGGGVLLLALFALFVWGMQTRLLEGSVTGMTWEHNTHVQTWKQVAKSEWRHLITERSEIKPRNGKGERAGVEIRSCREKHYEDERYQCGTKQEDYDCSTTRSESYSATCTRRVKTGESCRDNGNGFATCTDTYGTESYSCTKTRTVRDPKTCQRTVPKYCTRPIYRPHCTYQTQKWVAVRTVTASGNGVGETYWKEVDLGPLDRTTRSTKYRVSVDYEDRGKPRHYTLKPGSLREYESWIPGEVVTLERRNFGTIKKMTHGGLEVPVPE